MTPCWERVFPKGSDLTEIDAERYILIVRNWGRRQYKKLDQITKELDELLEASECQWECGEQGYPIIYMDEPAYYCGSCMKKDDN